MLGCCQYLPQKCLFIALVHIFLTSLDISAGSVNVMNSLKEKLAEKSARGSLPGNSRTTPSRVHAMLNDQLGNVEDETESMI